MSTETQEINQVVRWFVQIQYFNDLGLREFGCTRTFDTREQAEDWKSRNIGNWVIFSASEGY